MKPSGREERTIECEELRIEDGDEGTILGYAAVFNKKSQPLGFLGFREQIAPGAFADTIKGDDIRALFNHDPNMVLGRTRNSTLALEEDNKGLRYVITPPNTTWADDLRVSIKRGDITQSSFGFEVVDDSWEGEDTKSPLRTLRKVNLFDVSPVTFPAYTQTSVKARSMTDLDMDWDAIIGALTKRDKGISLNESDYTLIEETIEALRGYLPVPELPADVDPVSHQRLQRYLKLAERI